jgi:uncharacterized protein HemX
MDPATLPATQPPSTPAPFGTVPGPIMSSSNPRNKILKIVAVTVVILIIGGGGISVWAIQNRNNQLAAQARLAAQTKAKADAEAKARQGTISEIDTALDTESKKTQDLNDSAVFNSGDSLKQESEAAVTIGTGNENGL